MKSMSWNEFYNGYEDMAVWERKECVDSLINFGPNKEVLEVVEWFYLDDEEYATKFAVKAINSGVRFNEQEFIQLAEYINDYLIKQMLEKFHFKFTQEQMDELYGCLDDETYNSLAKRLGYDVEEEFVIEQYPKRKKRGILSSIVGGVATAMLLGDSNKKHSGRCDGDCANCPPHYGYRYGRWYYGHSHVHGCEFGGNKGDGAR